MTPFYNAMWAYVGYRVRRLKLNFNPHNRKTDRYYDLTRIKKMVGGRTDELSVVVIIPLENNDEVPA